MRVSGQEGGRGTGEEEHREEGVAAGETFETRDAECRIHNAERRMQEKKHGRRKSKWHDEG